MKKKLLTLVALLGLLSPLYSQPFYYNYYSSGNTAGNSGHSNIIADYIYLGPTNFNVIGPWSISAQGLEEVHLQSELRIAPDNTGTGHFFIDPNMFEVVSFHPNGFANIPTYDRFELGIKLPALVQSQINTFITTYTSPVNQPVPGLNPYDPDQIKIECIVTTPSGGGFVRNGFYYQPYSVSNNTYIEGSTDFPFRIRIGPPQVGAYHCDINIYIHGQTTLTWNNITFTAVSSGKHGNLILEPNLQKMKFEDGTSYFGIGEGMVAPGIVYNDDDPGGNPSFSYFYSLDGAKAKASPNTQDNFRARLNDLADKGGNFARVWFITWAYPLEYRDFRSLVGTNLYSPWNCINNYHHNQMFLSEFDKTLEVCEQRDIYLMLNIFNDQNTNGGDLQFDWDYFPYSTLLGQPADANHGATESGVLAFFTDPTAIATFKKQLYYINARWGYSPNVALWEMINETENIKHYNATDANPSTTVLNIQSAVKDWVCDMAAYMKSFYPVHLTTNGTTGAIPSASVPDFKKRTFQSRCLDVYSGNDYDDEIDPNLANLTIDNHINIKDLNHGNGAVFFNDTMPYLWGELGLGTRCAPPISYSNKSWLIPDLYTDRSFHNNLWSTAVSGNVATGLNNNDSQQDYIDHRANFKPLKKFVDQVDWNKKLIPQRYNANPLWANVSTGKNPNDPQQIEHLIYNLYMKDPTNTYVVGWTMIHPSFWVYDQNYSSFPPIPTFNDILNCIGYPKPPPQSNLSIYDYNHLTDYDVSPSIGDAIITITGMSQPNRWYRAEIFDPYDANINSFSIPVLSDGNSDIIFHLPFYNHRDISNDFIPPDRAYIIHDDSNTYNYAAENTGALPRQYTQLVQYAGDMGGNDEQGNARMTGQAVEVIQYEDGKTVRKKLISESNQQMEIQMQNINVFPNPANGMINIAYDENYFANSEIYIFDLAGKKLISSENVKQVNVKDLDPGMYMIKFKNNDAEKTFKISIER